jgi:hypothetical protein
MSHSRNSHVGEPDPIQQKNKRMNLKSLVGVLIDYLRHDDQVDLITL